MKSVIICEGSTDLVLVQYFMEKVNGWVLNSNRGLERRLERSGLFGFQYLHNFSKDDKKLTIGETGGCSNIIRTLEKVLDSNRQSSYENELFDNIVIICDRDEVNSVDEFDKKLEKCFVDVGVSYSSDISNDVWLQCICENSRGVSIGFRILLLIIPFEETGALETFLLNAISATDDYDKCIIIEGNEFVDAVDTESRYLTKRRYKTKAKFDVYFSIRTPLEQFKQRREILRGVPWEEFESIQNSFKKLKELG
jgi:hypothetical protein